MEDPGRTLKTALAGRFDVLGELGRGGMGTVFRARDVRHDRDVAIKVLNPELAGGLGPERFLQEIRVTARLDHPHILPLLDSGEAEGLLYYVMPYVEGESLRDRLDREKQLPVEDALAIALEVADALAHAHERSVVHRDVKPENILLAGGHARVADFGIARAVTVAGGDTLTAAGFAVGTPAYMSPEQAAGGRETDGRSDLYSLGCVLYEMLAGHPPFRGATVLDILSRHSGDSVPRLSVIRPRVPAALEAVIDRALAKVPADRHPTAASFADALRGAEAEGREGSGTAAGRPQGASMAGSRALRWAGLVGAGALLVLAGWGIMGTADRSEEIRSVAVLPFVNLTGDPEQEYFVAGMHDALISELAQIGAITVISRQSVVRYAGSELPLSAIARDLGADALVEGAVFLAGDSVRITVQLIRARPERHLWADAYHGALRDALGLHGEVARSIASAIRTTVTPELEARLARSRPARPEAQEEYLRGLYHLELQAMGGLPGAERLDTLRAAIAHLETAVALDPGWASAHADLARAYHWLASSGIPDLAAEFFPRSKAAALRALALDERNAQAHASLGFVLYEHDRDFVGAERAILRSLELDPNSNQWIYGLYLLTAGHWDEAVARLRMAEERNPLSEILKYQVAQAHVCAGRHDEALALLQGVRDRGAVSVVGVDEWLGRTHMFRGSFAEAVPFFERAVAATDSVPLAVARLGWAHALAGDRAAALTLLNWLEAREHPWYAPELYAALGETERAVAMILSAFERDTHGPPYTAFLCSPGYRELQGDLRIRELVRQIGYPGAR